MKIALLLSSRFKSLLTAGVSLMSALSFAPPAEACGGLFCSTSNPVNQVAERIIFAKNDNATVTAAIEIQYEGPSRAFAWVLPVPPGEVTVGVSSQQALDALQAMSNPVYSLQTTVASCGARQSAVSADSTGVPGLGVVPANNAPVSVVASGNTGPYDWVIIEVDPMLDDRADVAVQWLADNEFDVSGIGPEVLRIYLEQDMNLLAFRLSSDSDAGSIRPVMLTYEGERPMIPIQPTAVAAEPDMGVMVWVLGEGRAVPTNYLSLEINEARINWLDPNSTYNEVVIEAANEAGGFGFVTEQSGDASVFAETIFPSYKEVEWEGLRTAQFASVEAFLQQAISLAQSPFVNVGPFGGLAVSGNPTANLYDGFIEVLQDPEIVPLREGATAEQLLACVSCYFAVDVPVRNGAYPATPYVPGEDPLETMDVAAFLDELERLVVAPLQATRELFETHAKVTRLYTTLSPDEMLVDPVFDINPDLDDVSNQHVAERVMDCGGDSWTIKLPQGHTIEGSGAAWPIASTMDPAVLPYNARLLQLTETGKGEVVSDNYDDISVALIDLGIGGVDPKSPVAQERGTVGSTATPEAVIWPALLQRPATLAGCCWGWRCSALV